MGFHYPDTLYRTVFGRYRTGKRTGDARRVFFKFFEQKIAAEYVETGVPVRVALLDIAAGGLFIGFFTEGRGFKNSGAVAGRSFERASSRYIPVPG